jgi:hypothetical protein
MVLYVPADKHSPDVISDGGQLVFQVEGAPACTFFVLFFCPVLRPCFSRFPEPFVFGSLAGQTSWGVGLIVRFWAASHTGSGSAESSYLPHCTSPLLKEGL